MVAVVVWYASIHDVDDAGGVKQNEGESVNVVADTGALTVRAYSFQHGKYAANSEEYLCIQTLQMHYG